MLTKKEKTQIREDKYVEHLSQDLVKSASGLARVDSWSLGDAIDIEIDKLKPFSKHKFKINEDKVSDYQESIRVSGLWTPIIVWDKKETDSGEYEILAGHHRVEACKNLGWEKIPAIIKKGLTIEDAIDIADYTNLMQRSFESLTLFEKCDVIAQMKENRQKQEAKNPEIKIENESKEKDDSVRSISREFGVSKSLVAEYLTLYKTFSKKQIEAMEDTQNKKKIFDIKTGLLLSKLSKKAINDLFSNFEQFAVSKLCKEQAKMLIDCYEKNNEWNIKDLNYIFNKFYEIKQKSKPLSLQRDVLNKYFDEDMSSDDIMQVIIEMLENRKE